jgi:cell division septation protein DedD
MEVANTRSSPVQTTQQATSSQKAKQAAQETQSRQAEAKPVSQPSAKPVVNGQGQTTGRLLNVTA